MPSTLVTHLAALHIPVITSALDMQPFLIDWRKRYQGNALAVVQPRTLEQVRQVVQACHARNVAIVPQGGNTGLVGGSVPVAGDTSIVLSLRKLSAVRALDQQNLTITVEAGCTLSQVQDAAAGAGLLFPLSLASEGSCTIGGNLSSNAGGVQVLRYGNARELCLGIEAVMPDGTALHALRGLRKDNTGYALKDLLIGAEGTLGVITAAVMKLFPRPRTQIVAFVALESVEAAVSLLGLAQKRLDSSLTGFELIAQICLDLVSKHFKEASPLPAGSAYYVLLECSDSQEEAVARERFQQVLEEAMELELIQNAAVSASVAQNKAMWRQRELISEAQAAEGTNIKHDISLPVSAIAGFVRANSARLEQAFPGMRLVNFGHLGDGNLHYNVSPPLGMSDSDFLAHQASINKIVYDDVVALSGSISAEHGLGQLKCQEIEHYKSAAELGVMRQIKNALDPKGIMNPGKVLTPR
jgi:FAD/FMN-containing dehydrogenase